MEMFSPYRLGALELPNRIVMAPMTRSRATGGVPNDLMRTYYTQRASAGLIVTEGIAPSPNGLGYARIPGLFSTDQVRAWRSVTEGVHAAGGRILAQLMHVGRIAHVDNLPAGGRVVAPSAVLPAGTMWTDQQGPQPFSSAAEMSREDVRSARDELVQAARNAIQAGFDGVELHGANGYLLEQFLHPHTNRRGDEYGGSASARTRFVVEVADAVATAIGTERVGVRLSPHSTFNDLPPHDEVDATYSALTRGLRGLLYLHLVSQPHGAFPATARSIRSAFEGPLVLNGGFDRERAELALATQQSELVAFGRPFISNPDLVARLQRGAPLATPRPDTFYTPGAEGYIDYPPLAGR